MIGGGPGKGLSVRGGLWPAPSGGARGVALDPAQEAVVRDRPGNKDGKAREVPGSRSTHPARERRLQVVRLSDLRPTELMPYVTTKDHVRLYVKDWGTGRPVIMMHGWPLSADTFDDLSMAVAGALGLRAVAYDRRGFGRSDDPWGGYDYDTLADDLASVIHEYVGAGRHDPWLFHGAAARSHMSRHSGKGVKKLQWWPG